MSETKFTKGPWQFTKCGPTDSKGMGVCSMWGDWETQRVNIEANIHLIAAAPEMYKTLNEIADATVHNFNYETAKPIYDLLAKARGETE